MSGTYGRSQTPFLSGLPLGMRGAGRAGDGVRPARCARAEIEPMINVPATTAMTGIQSILISRSPRPGIPRGLCHRGVVTQREDFAMCSCVDIVQANPQNWPMRRTISVLVAGAGLILEMVPLAAHHSFAAEFDGNSPVNVTGVVTKIEWMNPHVWFYLDVKDSSGQVTNWGMEMGSPNALSRQGWTRKS